MGREPVGLGRVVPAGDAVSSRSEQRRQAIQRRPLHALTLVQPWAYAIARLGKPIENRTWTPPDWLIGAYLAIHAGKKLDALAVAALRDEGFDVPDEMQHGAIIAVARVVGWVAEDENGVIARWHGGLSRLDAFGAAATPWWMGPIGWVLDNVTAIDPVPCRGAQKLWRVPDPAADEVRRRWKEARHAA